MTFSEVCFIVIKNCLVGNNLSKYSFYVPLCYSCSSKSRVNISSFLLWGNWFYQTLVGIIVFKAQYWNHTTLKDMQAWEKQNLWKRKGWIRLWTEVPRAMEISDILFFFFFNLPLYIFTCDPDPFVKFYFIIISINVDTLFMDRYVFAPLVLFWFVCVWGEGQRHTHVTVLWIGMYCFSISQHYSQGSAWVVVFFTIYY